MCKREPQNLWRCFFALNAILISMLLPCGSFAGERLPIPGQVERGNKGVPHLEQNSAGVSCGLESLQFIRRYLQKGEPHAFGDIVKPEFLSKKGSDAEQLVKAAHSIGLHSLYRKNLTITDLAFLDSPAILRTRRSGIGTDYNHWIVYGGFTGGKIRVIDLPGEACDLHPSEFLAMWDNSAVIISKEPKSATFSIGWLFYGCLCMIALAAITVLKRRVDFRMKHLPFYMREIAIISATALALLVSTEILGIFPYFRNLDTINLVASRNNSSPFRECNSAYELTRIVDGSTVIIDCRGTSAYVVGRIPRSLCLPYNSPLALRRLALSGITADQAIVVYCQHSSCRMSDILAKVLRADGYRNVTIYRGGLDDWTATSLEKK